MEQTVVMKKEKPHIAVTSVHVDVGYSWVVLGANTLAFCIATGFLLTTGIVHTILEERFHEGAAKTSIAGSAFDAMFYLAGPLGSILVDKGSCRFAIMAGSLVMTIGFLVAAFSNTLELCIMFCGFLAGIGGGILHPALFVVIGFNFKDKYSIAQGITVASGGLGLFIMAPLLEIAKKFYGFSGFFLVMAACSLQMTACGIFLRPSELEKDAKRNRDYMLQKNSNRFRNFRQNVREYIKLMLNRTVLCLSMCVLTMNGAMFTIYILWPTFLQDKGFTPIQASYVLSVAGIASIVGRFTVGVIASFNRFHEVTIYSSAYAILAVPFLLFHFYSFAYVGHIISAVFVGLLSGTSFVLISSINVHYVGMEKASAAVGIEFFFGGLGAMAVPSLAGVLVSAGWGAENVFLIAAVSLILTAVFCMMIRCGHEQQQVIELDIPTVVLNEQNDSLLQNKETSAVS